jgi:hypothetical protein
LNIIHRQKNVNQINFSQQTLILNRWYLFGKKKLAGYCHSDLTVVFLRIVFAKTCFLIPNISWICSKHFDINGLIKIYRKFIHKKHLGDFCKSLHPLKFIFFIIFQNVDIDYENSAYFLIAEGLLLLLSSLNIVVLVLVAFIILRSIQFHKNLITIFINLHISGLIYLVCRMILIIRMFYCVKNCCKYLSSLTKTHTSFISHEYGLKIQYFV